jgi:DNA-binding CsgD family transcriptional regulator
MWPGRFALDRGLAVPQGQQNFAVAYIATVRRDGAPRLHPFCRPELTDRERQVLQRLVTGASNADIASALCLSPKTVRNHVSNIRTKLQVTDRTQAALAARAAGIRSQLDATRRGRHPHARRAADTGGHSERSRGTHGQIVLHETV